MVGRLGLPASVSAGYILSIRPPLRDPHPGSGRNAARARVKRARLIIGGAKRQPLARLAGFAAIELSLELALNGALARPQPARV
jgi:hypothetical protein